MPTTTHMAARRGAATSVRGQPARSHGRPSPASRSRRARGGRPRDRHRLVEVVAHPGSSDWRMSEIRLPWLPTSSRPPSACRARTGRRATPAPLRLAAGLARPGWRSRVRARADHEVRPVVARLRHDAALPQVVEELHLHRAAAGRGRHGLQRPLIGTAIDRCDDVRLQLIGQLLRRQAARIRERPVILPVPPSRVSRVGSAPRAAPAARPAARAEAVAPASAESTAHSVRRFSPHGTNEQEVSAASRQFSPCGNFHEEEARIGSISPSASSLVPPRGNLR